MKYFLKKTNLKKGEYLQIYISEYTREKGSRNRSFKAIGYTDDLKAQGIKDPVAKAKAEVDKLNARIIETESKLKAKKIGSASPEKMAGYFVLKGVANALPAFEKAVDALASTRQFQFDVYDTMMALVYARATMPASKSKTHSEVIPTLFEKPDDNSYAQILSCCEYLGIEYKKIAAYLTYAIQKTYGLDFSKTYFDCTNFYFEIDKEDGFRKKGPSKEHRFDPIVGLGLLLDKNQIPVSMTMFPGNESEKPYLRKVMADLKKESHITGRTIQVADKGLNCAHNIHKAILNKDGYLFSKSIKGFSNEDMDWFLNLDKEKGWTSVFEEVNGRKEVRYRYYSFIDDFDYRYEDEQGFTVKFTATEKRVLTFSPKLRMKKLIEINKLVDKAANLCMYKAKKDEFGECSKYVDFVSTSKGEATKEKAIPVLNMELIDKDRKLAGYNLLVTSERKNDERTIYNVYHNLWRIEQSFRMMKSYLDARPVYLTGEDSIKGHFLICYIGVVLERLLEFNVLGNRFNHEKILEFIRHFKLTRLSSKDYINTLTDKDEVGQFLGNTIFPAVTNCILTPADITELMKTVLKDRIEDF